MSIDTATVERLDIAATCNSIRDGLRLQRNSDNLPDSVYTISSDLLTDIADASELDREHLAMLQDLFVKWGRAQGYVSSSQRHREWLDQYAACYHAGLLPEVPT